MYKVSKYKKCKCPTDAWEEIVVKNDENYDFRTVIYYHCCLCGVDFRVEDFKTRKEVFYSEQKPIKYNKFI